MRCEPPNPTLPPSPSELNERPRFRNNRRRGRYSACRTASFPGSLVGGVNVCRPRGRNRSTRNAAGPGNDPPTNFLFQYLEPFDESNPSKVLLLKLWLDICRKGFDFPHCQLGHVRVLLPRLI